MGAPDGALPSRWGGGAGASGDFVAGGGAGAAGPSSLTHVGLRFCPFLHCSGGSGLGASLFWGDLAFAWFRLSSLAFAFLSFDWSVLRASTLRGACACYSRLGVRVGLLALSANLGWCFLSVRFL